MTEHSPSGATEIDVKSVRELMQVLVKCLRALQLYLPNNPIYRKAIENLSGAFAPVWDEWSNLTLTVTDTEFLCEGRSVLSHETRAESVAWVLYKDGIRSITLSPGVEDGEIVRFLNAINKARSLPEDASDDLLTLFWEEDFEHINYHYVEMAVDDVPPLDVHSSPVQQPEEIKEQVAEEVGEEPAVKGIVSIDDFDGTLYFLDQAETDYLDAEVKREYSQDLKSNVLAIVFDLLELQTYATVRAELISVIDNFVPYLLGVGDFSAVAYILRELKVILERARELTPEHRQLILDLPGKLSEPEALAQLLQSLDEAHVHPSEEELVDLFGELRPGSIGTVLGWLPRLSNERVKELLRRSVQNLLKTNPSQLNEALKSDDVETVTESITLAKGIKSPQVVPVVGELLNHKDLEIRHAAAVALAEINSPMALQLLTRALDDTDRDVRVVAVKALGESGYRGAFQKVEAVVGGKALKSADLTEKMAFFEAYGRLAGEGGLARLSELLTGKGLLKKKAPPETRACAAMALGKIRSPKAREMLEKGLKDKEAVVRNAVNKALKEFAS